MCLLCLALTPTRLAFPPACALPTPVPCSPVMLVQIVYKLAFLGTTIVPLAAQGHWSAFPAAPTAVYTAYLPLLLACAPWGYLLGSSGPDATREKVE